jgi:Tfp pilus assembly protein FimT
MKQSQATQGTTYLSMKGFTIFEMIISISIILLLARLLTPMLITYQSRNSLSTITNDFKSAIEDARVRSSLGEANARHGIYFDITSRTVTVYEGKSYAARAQASDVVTTWPVSITVTPSRQDINFSRIHTTTTQALITLQNQESEQKNITITTIGALQIQ